MKPHGYQVLPPMAHTANNRCFGCGHDNACGLGLEFYLSPDGVVICLPTISDNFHGHPGYLHGGIIATLLDEAMSKAVRALGYMAMTRKMDVEYLRPVPSAAPMRLEGRVTRSEGRKHWTEAAIWSPEEKLLAEAKGLFIEIRKPADAPLAID